MVIDPTNVERAIQTHRSNNGDGEPSISLAGDNLNSTNARHLVSFVLETSYITNLTVDCRVMDDGATEQMSELLKNTKRLTYLSIEGKSYNSPRWIVKGLSMNSSIHTLSFRFPPSDLFQSWGSTVQEILFAKQDLPCIAFSWQYAEPDNANFAKAIEGLAVQSNVSLLQFTGWPWSDESAASSLRIIDEALRVSCGLRVTHAKLGLETMKVLEERFLANEETPDLELPWEFLLRPDIKMRFWKLLKYDNTRLENLCGVFSVRYLNTVVDMEIQQFCRRNQEIEHIKNIVFQPIDRNGLGIWSHTFSTLMRRPLSEHLSPLFLALRTKPDEFVSLQPCGNKKKRPHSTGLLQKLNSEETKVAKLDDEHIVNLLSQLKDVHPWNMKGLIHLATCENSEGCSVDKYLFEIVPSSVWGCHNQQFDTLGEYTPLSAKQSEWLSRQIHDMETSQRSDIINTICGGTWDDTAHPGFAHLDNTVQNRLFHCVSQLHINSCIGCVLSLPPNLQQRFKELICNTILEQQNQELSDLTGQESEWLNQQIFDSINNDQLHHEITRIIAGAGVQVDNEYDIDLEQIPMATQRELLCFFSKAHHESVQHHWDQVWGIKM